MFVITNIITKLILINTYVVSNVEATSTIVFLQSHFDKIKERDAQYFFELLHPGCLEK